MAKLTADEYRVLGLLGEAATEFARLEPEHEADIVDFGTAVHAAQNIVLSRVGMRAQRKQFPGAPSRPGIKPSEHRTVGFGRELDVVATDEIPYPEDDE